MSDGLSVSVVTPSFNQAAFIERTIESVLTQDVTPLDYFVVDGGSTDGTVAVLAKFGDRLRFVSEPDRGQADAVNKGLAGTSGAIIGWLNSDDVYYPGALAAVRRHFAAHPEVDVVYGNADHIDEQDQVLEPYPSEPWDPARLVERCFVCQPAVFFRRRVVERLGPLDERLHFCLDYEYWLRIAAAGGRVDYLPRRLAGSRMYADNKTLRHRVRAHAETNDMLKRHLGAVPDRWLSNFAHVVLASREVADRDRQRLRFALMASALTLGAALRWNRALPPSLRRMTGSWVHGELQAWRQGTGPRPAPVRHRRGGQEGAWRIGLDVSQTGTDMAGCGQVATSVATAFEQHGGPHHYLLYPTFGDVFQDRLGPDATLPARRPNFERWTLPGPGARQVWRTPESPLDATLGHPDVVHGFNFYCPRGLQHARLVYTLHDLGFLEQPAWTEEANRQACFTGVFHASLHADLVVSLSEASRAHFLRTFPYYPEARTEIVPPPSRFADAPPVARPALGAPLVSGRFFLHVGTAEPRKNLDRLIEAHGASQAGAADPLPLVLAGGRGWHMDGFDERLRPLQAAGRVIRLGYVDDTTLLWLYQNCRALVFPSLFEGFGLPVLEALSQGTAVVASRVASIQEIGGDVVAYVDPYSTADLTATLTRLSVDDDAWARLRHGARQQASRTSARLLAERMLACYERVLASGPYRGARVLSPAALAAGAASLTPPPARSG